MIIFTGWAMLAVVAFFFATYNDDTSHTMSAFNWMWVAVMWPFVGAGFVVAYTGEESSLPILLTFLALGWIATGFFWACVFELLLMVMNQSKRKISAG
jgi:hypothetical protein